MKKTTPVKLLNLKKLESHTICGIFPPLGDTDYAVLCNSIKVHGFNPKKPIVLYEGKILDGANRYSASKKVRKEPVFREFDPTKEGMSAFDFVLQENLARRNLTPSQAAAVAAELASKWQEIEDAEAAAEKAKSLNSDSEATKGKKKPTGDKAKKAAKALGVSRDSVTKAKALAKIDPAALQDVKSGKKTLNAATQEVKKKQTKAERETEEFDTCRKLVADVYGEKDATLAEKNLKPKEFIQLAGLDEDEMKRVLNFVTVGGWTLKAALGFKSAALTPTHSLRDATDRCLAAGGKYEFDLGDYHVIVTRNAASAKSGALNPDDE